jgi:hypothetical protein
MNTKYVTALLTLTAAILTSASAATLGLNNSTAGSLADGWGSGDITNVTGSPFGGWSVSNSDGSAGFFIGDSKSLNGGAGGDVNVSGSSFGIYGNNGDRADAILTLDSPLIVGQALSFDIAVNFRDGAKGVDIRDGSDAAIFNFNVGSAGSGDDYIVNFVTTGGGSTGNDYDSNSVFNITLAQTSAGGGNWTIARFGGVTDSDSGTYTGVVNSLKLYNMSGTGGDENNLYANNFTVVPEPSTAGLLGPGAGTLILRRRRE